MTDHDHSLCILAEGAEAFCLATGKPGVCVGQKRGQHQAVYVQPKLRTVRQAPSRDLEGEHRRAEVVRENTAGQQRTQMIAETGGLKGKQAAGVKAAGGALKKVTTAVSRQQAGYERDITTRQRQHDADVTANAKAGERAGVTNAKRKASTDARNARELAADAKRASKAKRSTKSKGPVSVAKWLKYGVDGADVIDFWLGEVPEAFAAKKPGKCMYCTEPATHGVRWAEGMARIPVDERHLPKARAAVARNEGPQGVVGVDEVKDGKWVNHIGNYASVQVDEDLAPLLAELTALELYAVDITDPHLYGVLSFGHESCWIGQFCRNPLHPGPCKGWKHMLRSVAPGAYHTVERQRVDKLEARRKAKVAHLQSQGLKVPPRLLKPITYDPNTPTRGAKPNPAHWTPPTPAQAKAVLPPTSTQIDAKIKARRAQQTPAAPTPAPSSAPKSNIQHAGDAAAALVKSARAAGVSVSPQDATVLTANMHRALANGDKPSTDPVVGKAIDRIVQGLAAKGVTAGKPFTPQQLDDIKGNMRQHIDAGLPDLPILVESAANHVAPAGPSPLDKATKAAKDALNGKMTLLARLKGLQDLDKADFDQLDDATKQQVAAMLQHTVARSGTSAFGKRAGDIHAKLFGPGGATPNAPAAPAASTHVTDPAINRELDNQTIVISKRLTGLPAAAKANPPSDASGMKFGKADANGVVTDDAGRVVGTLYDPADKDKTGWVRVETSRPGFNRNGRNQTVSVWRDPTTANAPAGATPNAPAAPVAKTPLPSPAKVPLTANAQKAASVARNPQIGRADRLDAYTKLTKGDHDSLPDDAKGEIQKDLQDIARTSAMAHNRQRAASLHQRLYGSPPPNSSTGNAPGGAAPAAPSSPSPSSAPSSAPSAPSGGGGTATAVKTRPAATATGSAPLGPNASAAATHAHAVANRTAPGAGVAKKQLDAYRPLTKGDFDALPDASKQTILTDLTAAKAKFLDPKKQADAQALIDRFAGKGDGAAPKKTVPPAAPSSAPKAATATAPGGVNVANRADAYRVLRTPQTTSASVKLPIFAKLTKDDYDSMPAAMQDALKRSLDEADRSGLHAAAVATVRANLGLSAPAGATAPTPGGYNPRQAKAADLAGPKVDTSTDRQFLDAANDISRKEYEQLSDADRKAVMDRLSGIGSTVSPDAAGARAAASRLGGVQVTPTKGGTPTTTPQPVRDVQVLLNSPTWRNTSPPRRLDLLKDLKKEHLKDLTPAEVDKIKATLDEVDQLGGFGAAVDMYRSRLGMEREAISGDPYLDAVLAPGAPKHLIVERFESATLSARSDAKKAAALEKFRAHVENDTKQPDWLRAYMYGEKKTVGYNPAVVAAGDQPERASGLWHPTVTKLQDLYLISDAEKAKLPDYVRRSLEDRRNMAVTQLLRSGGAITQRGVLTEVFGDNLTDRKRYDELDSIAQRRIVVSLREVRDHSSDPVARSRYQRTMDMLDGTAAGYDAKQKTALDKLHDPTALAGDKSPAYEAMGKDLFDKLPSAHRDAILHDLKNIAQNAIGGYSQKHARHTSAKLMGDFPDYTDYAAQNAALAATVDKPGTTDTSRWDAYKFLTGPQYRALSGTHQYAVAQDLDQIANKSGMPVNQRFDAQKKRDQLTQVGRSLDVLNAIDHADPSLAPHVSMTARVNAYGSLSYGEFANLPKVYQEAIDADLQRLSVGSPNSFNVLMQKFHPGWTPPHVAAQPATPVRSNTDPAIKDALDALYGLHPKSQHVSHQLKTYGGLRTAQFQQLASHEQQTLLADLSYIATTSKGANALKAQKIIDRFTPPGTPAGVMPKQAIIPPVNAVAGQVRDPNPAGTSGLLVQAKDKGQGGDGWTNAGGKNVWGKYGAAGVMLRHVDSSGTERYLMVQRGTAISDPGKWQFPGGAIDSKETPHQGAARETIEELGFKKDALEHARVHGHHENAIPGSTWKYTSIVATVDHQLQADLSTHHARAETADAKWMTLAEIQQLDAGGKLLAPLARGQLERNVISLFPTAAHQPAAARPGPVTKKPARLTGTPSSAVTQPGGWTKPHKPSKGKNLLATPAQKDQLRQDVKQARKKFAGKTADDRLAAIGEIQGYDDVPTVMSKADVDRLLATGDYIEVWRGVKGTGWRGNGKTAAQINEEMRSGPAYYGKGVFGNGYYLATKKSVATQYADGSKNSVARMLIPKSAVIKEHDEMVRGAHANSSPRTKAKGSSYEDGTLWDEGRYAAAIGADGIKIEHHAGAIKGMRAGHVAGPGKPAFNWLNRSVLIIQEAE